MKYTPEITKKLLDDFCVKKLSIDTIAKELNVSKRSVITKLSHQKVYFRPKYVTKSGELPIKKIVYAELIAEELGVPPDDIECIEKLNKRILKTLCIRLGIADKLPTGLP